MENPDIINAVTPVTEAFEELSIPYYISGLVASSLYGIALTTIDVDLAAAITAEHIPPLNSLLEREYYIDEEMIKKAIRRKTTFNLIHLESMIKIDVFVVADDPFQIEALKRRRKDIIEEGEINREYYFASPEDVILNKLLLFKMGGGESERQWMDIIGIIKVQRNLLDKEYLTRWAEKLNVINLLEKAYHGAGRIS